MGLLALDSWQLTSFCSGCWIVLPAYMTYVYGGQILDSLAPPAKKSE